MENVSLNQIISNESYSYHLQKYNFKYFVAKTLVCIISFVFLSSFILGCEDGPDESGSYGHDNGASSGNDSFRELLVDYNRKSEDIFCALEGYVSDVQQLGLLLETIPERSDEHSWEAILALVDGLIPPLDAAEAAAVDLLEIDQAIRRATEEHRDDSAPLDKKRDEVSVSQHKLLVTAVGVTLLVGGLIEFCKTMRGKSDQMIEERHRRDDALGRLVGDPSDESALDDYNEAVGDMVRTGQEVLTELGSKIVVDSATQLIPTGRISGVILQDRVANELQHGLKVISATHACGEEDNPNCRIGLATTKPQPPGSHGSNRVILPGEPYEVEGVEPKSVIRISGSSSPQEEDIHVVRMGFDDYTTYGISEEQAQQQIDRTGNQTTPPSQVIGSGHIVEVPIPLATPALVARLDDGTAHPDLIATLGEGSDDDMEVEGGGSCNFGMAEYMLCWQYPQDHPDGLGAEICGHANGAYSSTPCNPGIGRCDFHDGHTTTTYYYIGPSWSQAHARQHCEAPETHGAAHGGVWTPN